MSENVGLFNMTLVAESHNKLPLFLNNNIINHNNTLAKKKAQNVLSYHIRKVHLLQRLKEVDINKSFSTIEMMMYSSIENT